MQCGVLNVAGGNAKYTTVSSGECGACSVKSEVGVWNVKCAVQQCRVCNMECCVERVQTRAWTVEWRV